MKLLFLCLQLIKCYILPNIMINNIYSLRVPYLVSLQENFLNNNTLNSSLENIKSVEYDEKEDMWILDLDNSVENEENEEKEEKEEKQERKFFMSLEL